MTAAAQPATLLTCDADVGAVTSANGDICETPRQQALGRITRMGTLQPFTSGTANTALTCPACGRVPHPRRARGALAKLVAAFPLELALHALVLWLHPPLLVAVLALAVTTTVLVIWVVEPSTMRLLASWLHAPALRAQAQLHDAESLWRMRVTLRDEPGALRSLTHELAELGASVLDLSVHPLASGVRDEIVVSAPQGVTDTDLARAAARGGASEIRLWPTTAMTLVDGTTKALSLASHVALAPEDLPAAIAQLLGAEPVASIDATAVRQQSVVGGDHFLRLPTPWTGLLVFRRREEPFTPAEIARAHRLAEIAEAAHLASRRRPGPVDAG